MHNLGKVLTIVILTALLVPGAAAQDPQQTAKLDTASLAELGAEAPNPERVLWNQYGVPTENYYPAQDFETGLDEYDIWAADNFMSYDDWIIDTIWIRGSPAGLDNATALHWYICTDSGEGYPGCVPGDGTAQWELHLAPDDPQVSLGEVEPGQVALSLEDPVELPGDPDHSWWLIFQVSLDDWYGYYGWSGTSDGWGSEGYQINPGGGWGYGTDWYPNENGEDLMFLLLGEVVPDTETLWHQYYNPSANYHRAQDPQPGPDDFEIWAADDFENSEGWVIDQITIQGGTWTLADATELHWYICRDWMSLPSCVGGYGTEYWDLHLAPTDPQVNLVGEHVYLNLDDPIYLPADTWWLVFQASLDDYWYGEYGWRGTSNEVWGEVGHQINPGEGWGQGNEWFPNDDGEDLMFQLRGGKVYEESLWDQTIVASQNDYLAQDFEPGLDEYDIWAADDFENEWPWRIDRIWIRGGWDGPVDLNNASAIHWYICEDYYNQPGCVPPGGANTYWELHLAPSDPQVQLDVSYPVPQTVLLNLDTPIDLPPAKWWLVSQVSLDDWYGYCGWSGIDADVQGEVGQQLNPGEGWGQGTYWYPNENGEDFAFRLTGWKPPVMRVEPESVEETLLTDSSTTVYLGLFNDGGSYMDLNVSVVPDVPWLWADCFNCYAGPGDGDSVIVQLDSTGLDPGAYTAGILIEGYDSETGETVEDFVVPVTLHVKAPMEAMVRLAGRVVGDKYVAMAVARVKDLQRNPIEGAEVTMYLKKPNGNTDTQTRTTNAHGTVVFSMASQTGGYWLACLDDVQHDLFQWFPGAKCSFLEFPPP